MYEEFLKAVLAYVEAMNKVSANVDESDGLTPYVNHIPVVMDDDLCGFLRDEIGGAYAYREADEAEREWWAQRPWKRHV